MVEQSLYRVWPTVAKLLDVSRGRAYELVASGELPSVRLSPRAIRVPASSLEAYIERKMAEAEESESY